MHGGYPFPSIYFYGKCTGYFHQQPHALDTGNAVIYHQGTYEHEGAY